MMTTKMNEMMMIRLINRTTKKTKKQKMKNNKIKINKTMMRKIEYCAKECCLKWQQRTSAFDV